LILTLVADWGVFYKNKKPDNRSGFFTHGTERTSVPTRPK
jgi:hypothetical protein